MAAASAAGSLTLTTTSSSSSNTKAVSSKTNNSLPCCQFIRSSRGLGFLAASAASFNLHAHSSSYSNHPIMTSSRRGVTSAATTTSSSNTKAVVGNNSLPCCRFVTRSSRGLGILAASAASFDLHALSSSSSSKLTTSTSNRRRGVMISAAKKSVGDLSPAELKGKKVFTPESELLSPPSNISSPTAPKSSSPVTWFKVDDDDDDDV